MLEQVRPQGLIAEAVWGHPHVRHVHCPLPATKFVASESLACFAWGPGLLHVLVMGACV